MRNMSFSLTERQLLDGIKTVTRRIGWDFLKRGDRLRAVRKSMGLKRGEHPVVLGVIEVVMVSRERLCHIRQAEVCAEGFPRMTRKEFIQFFCRHMKCPADVMVTRIEFRLVEITNEHHNSPARSR